MGRVFSAIAIGLAVLLAGVTAYFTLPAGYLMQLPSFPQFAAAEAAGPTAQLTYAVDQDALRDAHLEDVSIQMAAALREATPSIPYNGRGVRNGVATVGLADPGDRERALSILRAALARTPDGAPAVTFSAGADNAVEARLTPAYLQSLTVEGATHSAEVIRRRIDPTGNRRVTVQLASDHRIVVRVPGAGDTAPLHGLVAPQGLLTFHLVRELSPAELSEGRAPAGTMLVESYPGFDESIVAVEQRARITGDHLTRAEAATDPQTEQWVLAFRFDGEGTRLFCRVTRDNVGNRLAILLDNRVLTAPRINEPICAGTGQISANFTAQSANELTLMLNAGALPAPLLLIDERIVGNPN